MSSIESVPAKASAREFEAIQLSMKSLFLLITFCAIGITLVRQFFLAGTIVLFVAASIGSVVMLRNDGFRERRFWLQAIWGILLPLCCLVTDPILFQGVAFYDGTVPATTVACYVFVGWQMLMLGASWIVTPRQATLGAFLSGSLFAGLMFAVGVGVVLAIPTVIFAIFIVGLPGLTPWFTGAVFQQACRSCWLVGMRAYDEFVCFAIAGMGCLASFAVAGTAYWAWTAYGMSLTR